MSTGPILPPINGRPQERVVAALSLQELNAEANRLARRWQVPTENNAMALFRMVRPGKDGRTK